MGWSSFPPEHKKSFYIGLSLYVLCVCAAGVWIKLNAASTLHDWQERTPHATATISAAYPANTQQTSSGTPAPDDPFAAAAGDIPSGSGGSITIVMSGLGLSQDITQRAVNELPPATTFAFSPYSPGLKDWLQKSANPARERLIMVPMEPLTYPKDDPGPLALLTRQSADDNASHLAFILNNAAGTVGVINQMGSAFLGDQKDMITFLATLRQRHDLFIENPAGGIPQAALAAEQSGVPYLAADLTIDASAAPQDVQQQLVNLEKIARRRGYALGIARPYPVTIDILKTWAANLDARGITLVTPGTLLKVQMKKIQESQQKQQEQQEETPDTTATPQISTPAGTMTSPAPANQSLPPATTGVSTAPAVDGGVVTDAPDENDTTQGQP